MGAIRLSADEAFERDIRPELRDDVMQMMAGTAGEWERHDCVTILERDRLDAINVWCHGIVEVEGEEYTFQIEDGNNAGTVLRDWNGSSGRDFEPVERVRWALQPTRDLIDRAIVSGHGPFLVAKWDAFLRCPEIRDIPGNYTYDRMVQPGHVSGTHWRAQAAKYHFDLVDQEQADETRRRLLLATEAFT